MLLQIIFILFSIYLWFQYKFLYWKKLGFSHVPGKIPVGSGSDVGSKEHLCDFLKREYDKFKNISPAFGVYFMTKPVLVPTDPELIRDIFVRNFETFHERGLSFCEKADPLSQHLFFKNGQEWKDLRGKLTQVFTSGRMKMMFPNVLEKSDNMINYLKSCAEINDALEMKEVFSSFTTEVIADVAFGFLTECIDNPNNEFRRMGNAVFEPTAMEHIKLFFIMSYGRLASFLGIGLNRKATIKFFMGIVQDVLKFREDNQVHRNDFLQLLINMKNSENETMTFNEIAAASFGFFLAGYETSSSTMTFCAYELALNQNIQEKIRLEISQVLLKYNGKVTYEAIMEMKYLDMVFNETLRKYPVIDVQRRKSVKDFKIPNTNLVIPAETIIMIPVYALQNDERFWENPDKFDPERFTQEEIAKRHPFCYIPFSEGPRQCIGMRFGQMQTKIGIVKLLMNFKIQPCEKTTIPMKFVPNAVFQTPIGGMWLKIEKL
ncbi:hypothetical protein PVAND_015294 [Polypedilum vanderplanki]|uniref:Cytochrome P450 n=1 Tax=Polypedilum vanderplanki TaxID=319348 RepID=A0A9J6BBV4_POLVA|nr:hypothetical protein PVAND_015294 [Polypedilum vanderplanki]